MACAEVPLLRRLAYGVLDREGLRTDELARLTWADVDLVHNRLDLDENKTDRPRSWDMRPDVLMALTIWRERFRKKAASDARVFLDDEGAGLNVDHLAAQLRDDLARAQVDRAKLFQGSRNRLRMRAHDLRATFVTVSLASGRTWEWCQQRTGHGDAMKQKYRRTSATWTAQRQGDLAPLHLAIPELSAHSGAIAPRIAPRRDFRLAAGLPILAKVHGKGLEPLCLAAAEPKSAASASFATRAVSSRGIPGPILAGGSVAASSRKLRDASVSTTSGRRSQSCDRLSPIRGCVLRCSDNPGRDACAASYSIWAAKASPPGACRTAYAPNFDAGRRAAGGSRLPCVADRRVRAPAATPARPSQASRRPSFRGAVPLTARKRSARCCARGPRDGPAPRWPPPGRDPSRPNRSPHR